MFFSNIFQRVPKQRGIVRRFDGAAGGRRGFGMGSFHRINPEVAAAGPSLRSRARYLAANNAWISQAVANWTASLVGSGIVPTAKHSDTDKRRDLNLSFQYWAENADADIRTDFWGIQADVARSLIIDGEAFLQIITTENGPRLRQLSSQM